VKKKKPINQRRFIMIRKCYLVLILALCLGLILTGCPKKTVPVDEATTKKSDDAARVEAERAAREKAEMEAREKEAARIKEEEARRAREKEFEKSLTAKKQPGIEGEVLESKLLKDVSFDFDKYDVRPQDINILKEDAAVLMKYPSYKIQIEGHCDERGTGEYNLALGERRANSVKKYLVSLGVPADRLSTISYGKEMPVDPAHNEEAWAKNRRAHFVILSK
jgi:peptidoglycan-associated lipoprotein